MTKLRTIGHSLVATLDECLGQGMEKPPANIDAFLEAIDESHESLAYRRYGHLHHPPRASLCSLLAAGGWALAAAADHVALSQKLKPPIARMHNDARRISTLARRLKRPA